MKLVYNKEAVKYFSLLIILICLSPNETTGQSPDTLWTRTFGGSNIDIAHDVQLTSDGGFIITGYTRSFGTTSGRNAWLLKTDMFGNLQWHNTYGGNSDDEGHAVQQTFDGGYIIAGLTNSFGAGLKDMFMVKTDSLGNQQWMKTFGGANDDEAYSVLQTSDGGYLLAGVTSSFAVGGRDVFLVKTDASGNFSWQKSLGGLGSDGAWDIKNTSDGGYILAGWTFSHGPGSVGNAWLVKTDSLGNQLWHQAFGGTGVDRAYSVQQTTDGGYILAGYTSSFGAGLDDMLLIKTDNLGNQQWMKTFGGTGRDYGYSVQQTSEGGFIITGYTLSYGAGGDDVYLVKTDSDGNLEWFKTYGGSSSDVGYAVRETPDGGCIIAGHTLSYGAGVHDAWLIRLDYVIPVELNSFTASVSGNNVTLSWSTVSERNNKGFEVHRLTADDNVKSQDWEMIGFVNGMGTTLEFQLYNFSDSDVKPGIYSYRLKQIDFDGSYQYSDIVEVEVSPPDNFILYQNYPNPFNPSTIISWQSPADGWQKLTIFDVLGNEIATLVDEFRPAGKYEIEFTAVEISSGVYFFELETEKFLKVRKMLLLR